MSAFHIISHGNLRYGLILYRAFLNNKGYVN